MSFCRPAYSDVLTFHEIDNGELGVDDVRSLELAGAGIARTTAKSCASCEPSKQSRKQVKTPQEFSFDRSTVTRIASSALFTDIHCHRTTLKS